MIPDIEVSDVAGVAPRIQKYGVAIWRKLVPMSITRRLVEVMSANLRNPESYISVKNGVMSSSVCPPDLQSERVSQEIARVFESVVGGQPQYDPTECSFFISAPNFQPYAWHQDGPYVPAYYALAWIALTDCGVTAPGLTFALTHPQEFIFTDLEKPEKDKKAEVEARAADVVSKAGYTTVNLVLGAGDVVFFDSLSVHKTNRTPEMTLDRAAYKLAAYKRAPSVGSRVQK